MRREIPWPGSIASFVQSFMADTPFEAAIIKDGVDHTAVEGAADLPYDIPNLLVDWKRAPDGVPTLWWRSVGHSHTAFVVESFVDELAHAAGRDPWNSAGHCWESAPATKRSLSSPPKRPAGGQPLPEGHGRGLAVHESFGSFVAEVAEVSVARDGQGQSAPRRLRGRLRPGCQPGYDSSPDGRRGSSSA